MYFGDIDFPQPIVEALEKEELVIFAGAGVSTGRPSCLPRFRQLARLIAGPDVKCENGEPLDRFLGRVQRAGTDVHSRAREFLRKPGSRPTRLHRDLVGLFGSAERVRLVTTNQDLHFSTVAREAHESLVAEFHAPALPVGAGFSGILYLHGAVEPATDAMVLTDGDFGRAYLTEGWATRFLCDLFERNVVLFVGYSCDDTTMRYLTRGLPSGSARYALTPYGRETHWQHLDIEPIPYDAGTDHRALRQAVSEWKRFATMDGLQHASRIREIVSRFDTDLPLPDKATEDYLCSMLRRPNRANIVTRQARGTGILRWIENKGYLQPLFHPHNDLDGASAILASWFARYYVVEHSQEALALVERSGCQMNPQLWDMVLQSVAFSRPTLHGKDLAGWVQVLVQARPPNQSPYYLGCILGNCTVGQDAKVIAELFALMSTPRLVPQKSLPLGPSRPGEEKRLITWDVSCEDSSHSLADAWENTVRPNLAQFVEDLEPVVLGHLRRANALQRSVGQDHDVMDWHCEEIHNYDPRDEASGIGVLVVAARDLLVWRMAHDAEAGVGLVERWRKSIAPLERRLAVYGVAMAENHTADWRIRWLVDSKFLVDETTRREVQHLLQAAYPGCSEKMRRRLLRAVEEEAKAATAAYDEDGRFAAHDTYEILAWLRRADPSCPMVARRIAALEKSRPELRGDVAQVRPPGVMAGLPGQRSPFTAEQLVLQEMEALLSLMRDYKGDEVSFGPSRAGLMVQLEKAVAESYEWSLRLADVLSRANMWTDDVWGAIVAGWASVKLSARREDVLGLLLEKEQLHGVNEPIARLLAGWATDSESPLSPEAVDQGERLACRLRDAWTCVSGEGEGEAISLMDAMHAVGWNVAEFMVYATYVGARGEPSRKRAMSARQRDFFQAVLCGGTPVDRDGRILLASRMAFFYDLDEEWTRRNLFRLLDWTAKKVQAAQAWQGLLNCARVDTRLLKEVLPFLQQCVEHVREFPDYTRQSLPEVLVLFAVYGDSDPIGDKWLKAFVNKADPRERGRFAWKMWRELEEMDEQALSDLWGRWLGRYWEDRVQNNPPALVEDEWDTMSMWLTHLGPAFVEAAGILTRGKTPPLKGSSVFRDLEKSEFPARYPREVADLVLALLNRQTHPYHGCGEVHELVKKLRVAGAPRDVLRRIVSTLVDLGDERASDLLE